MIRPGLRFFFTGDDTLLRSVLFLLGLMIILAQSAPVQAGDSSGSQVTVEVGAAFPYGQLGANFENTRLGLGATRGLELGFSYRIHLSETVSIAPTFFFLDYGNYEGFNDELGDYRVQSSSYRYAAELMVKMPGTDKLLRPFLAVGAGLNRNRVTGFYQDNFRDLEKSINTMGYSLRVGAQLAGLEFSVLYNINRFNTWQFYHSDFRERYNWDNVGLRAGWLIPFGD